MPQSGYIVVGNNTTASGVNWTVAASGNQTVFASGALGPENQTNPVAVSGYEFYEVRFFPVGGVDNSVTVDKVTIGGGDPTKVTLAQGVV